MKFFKPVDEPMSKTDKFRLGVIGPGLCFGLAGYLLFDFLSSPNIFEVLAFIGLGTFGGVCIAVAFDKDEVDNKQNLGDVKQ